MLNWCMWLSICGSLKETNGKKNTRSRAWQTSPMSKHKPTTSECDRVPPPAARHLVMGGAINSTNGAFSFGHSWALSSSIAWRESSVLAMLYRREMLRTSRTFSHSKFGSCETIWNLLFDSPARNLKFLMLSSDPTFFCVSWHAEVNGMHSAYTTRSYLVDRKRNETPNARRGRQFYHFATDCGARQK